MKKDLLLSGFSISLHNEPWFSTGISMSDESPDDCPYEEGSDSQNAWFSGRRFANELGFNGMIQILLKQALNGKLDQSDFKALHLLPDVVNAAHELKNDWDEAARFLKIHSILYPHASTH